MSDKPKYTLHEGDDYLEITCPTGMILVAKYVDDNDRTEAEKMVKRLNE